MKLRISRHAIERFVERIRPLPTDRAREEMRRCIEASKPRHLRKATRQPPKKTTMIPTGCCIFVCSRGVVATVIARS